MRRRDFLTTAAVAAAAGCQSPLTDASFDVPDAVLIDSRFEPVIRGLPSNRTVRIEAQAEDGRSYTPTWSAAATFRSDESGTVSLADQAPLSGDYRDVDSMGLFWSMETAAPAAESFFPPRRHDVTLSASLDDEVVAKARVQRRVSVDDVGESSPDGLTGTVYTPPGEGSVPGVLVLHGSRPSEMTATAKLLSSHGFVALAVQYFGNPEGIPDVLSEVPVEYAQRALEHLLAHPRVGGSKIGVWGVSKGAELGLLLASHDARVGAVVGVSPSTLVWEGFDREGVPTGRSSWTLGGDPVPYVPLAAFEDVPGDPTERPRELYEYSQLRAEPGRIADATIPVEEVTGRLTLFSGTADNVWHSTAMADSAMDRLADYGRSDAAEHRAFDGAGHAMVLPYLPTYGASDSPRYPLGGSPVPNALSSEGHWVGGLQTLADLGGDDFDPTPTSVDPVRPAVGLTEERAIVMAAMVLGAIGLGAFFRRQETGTDHAPVVGFLRSSSGRVALGIYALVAGSALVFVGRTGLAAIAGFVAFLIVTDEFVTRAWERLYALVEQFEGAREGPSRELMPHAVSTTTKVVVILGLLLFLWYLLVSVVLVWLASIG